MTDTLLPQDELLASTMTHREPAPNPLLQPKGGAALMYELLGMPGQALLTPGRTVQSGLEEAYKGNYNPQDVSTQTKMIQDALMLSGYTGTGALPFRAPSGSLGMFVPASMPVIKQAEQMTVKGATKEAIWTKLGVFQGKDGMWRREIPDSPTIYDRGLASTVGQQLDHPELFAAYPDLAHIQLAHDMPPGEGQYRFDKKPEEIGISEHPDYDEAGLSVNPPRETLLHEIMHAIQQRAGFAKGGNPEMIRPIVREALQAAGIDNPNAADIDWYAHESYRRLAGEVEARNVQRRSYASPKWLREHPPWTTEDVPREKQTVINSISDKQASRPPTWTQPELEEIARLHSSGLGPTEIAQKFPGKSPGAIRMALARSGLRDESAIREVSDPLTPKQQQQVFELAKQGKSQRAIADELGISKSVIGRTLTDKDSLLTYLQSKGYSFQQMANMTGLTRSAVAGRLFRRRPVIMPNRALAGPSLPKVNLPAISEEDYQYGLKHLKFTPVDHDPFK